MTRSLAAALLAWMLAPGCFAPPAQTPAGTLVEAATQFADQLRWAKVDQLVGVIPPEKRKAFLDRHDKLREECEVTEFEIARAEIGKTRDDGKVRVTFTWHGKGDWIVHKTTLELTWARRSERWILLTSRRANGDPWAFETL